MMFSADIVDLVDDDTGTILRSSVDELRALFEVAVAHLGTQAANIEKDLYVCWVLDFLFNRRGDDPIGLYFKGGTSLASGLRPGCPGHLQQWHRPYRSH